MVILFGGSKLLQLRRSLGEAIRGFKGVLSGEDNTGNKSNEIA